MERVLDSATRTAGRNQLRLIGELDSARRAAGAVQHEWVESTLR